MISLMASFTKAHYEHRRLPTLMLKHCSLSIYGVYGIHNTLHWHEAPWKAEKYPTFIKDLKIFSKHTMIQQNAPTEY